MYKECIEHQYTLLSSVQAGKSEMYRCIEKFHNSRIIQ